MNKTVFLFERHPRDFEDKLVELRSEGYAILKIMVRSREDGTAFCFAKLRRTVIGSVLRVLRLAA